MNNISIAIFPKEKYRVKIRHFRNKYECKEAGFNASTWATVVRIYDKDCPVILAEGVSRCRKNDCPDRRQGLRVALGRAAKELINNGFNLN